MGHLSVDSMKITYSVHRGRLYLVGASISLPLPTENFSSRVIYEFFNILFQHQVKTKEMHVYANNVET